MSRAVALLANWVLLWLLWIVFTASLAPQELLAGALAAAVVAFLSEGFSHGIGANILEPRRLAHLVAYVPYLVKEIVKANLQVARIVVDPRLPIHPGIVRVKTRLKTRVGRMVLANSITLTPGTLTVSVEDDELYVHWLDVRTGDVEEATRRIVAGFERYLGEIFG
jgi:multicomponent Na+:H+ antiporter subunit E